MKITLAFGSGNGNFYHILVIEFTIFIGSHSLVEYQACHKVTGKQWEWDYLLWLS